MTRRSAEGVAGLLVGLALLLGVPAAWAAAHADASGEGAVPVAAAPAPVAPVAPGPAAATAPVPVVKAPSVSELAARSRSADASRPVRLVVASAGVDAPVDRIGVDAAGAVAIPADARRVGWYAPGVLPGSATGSVALVGHRDSRTQARGALFRLAAVSVGDRVVLVTADGRRLTYRVVERRLYSKQTIPLRQFLGEDGPARLSILTCGGPYDSAAGGYRDNLVVTAVPA